MSNVSQIYGTLRNSEPYIILNSTQTEVSGNLSVLQNLDVCGNITFNNTDLSSALSNLVLDLTGGQDASFTNVEISGSLMLNNIDVSGKLSQIDASLVDLASGGGDGTITLSESDSLGNINVSLASNTLTIDAKNVSYSTNYCRASDNTDISNINITNFIKNAQTVIYLQADTSGNTIKGYTNAPIDDIKKNFADDIVLASEDIAILTMTRITNKYFLSASIFK